MEIRIGSRLEILAHGNFLQGVVKSKEGRELAIEITFPKKFHGVPLQINEEDVIFPNDRDVIFPNDRDEIDYEEDEEEKPLPKIILKNKKAEQDRPTELEILMQH